MGRHIRLLGEPAILDADGSGQSVRGHQAWALLARVLLARAPLDRRSLAAELFPETADPLGALRWCLASLRKAIDLSDCLVGDPIEHRLPDDVQVDVWRLDRDDFEIDQAGQLLAGIEPRCSPEFSTWLLVERERLAGIVDARIRHEVIQDFATGDFVRGVQLAELGVRRDPYNESAHILLVKGLALSGRYDAALAHVEATEATFLAELGEKPSGALRSAARRTISSPPGGISAQAVVNSLMRSGLAALSAGAADAGIDCLRSAVNEAGKIADSKLLATAMLELGTALVHAVRGFDEEGSVLLRQCTELARRSGCAAIASAGFRELGYVEALAGRRPAAMAYLETAVELADEDDNLAGIHSVIGFNLVDWGRIGEGIDHHMIALDHARRAGKRRREIWSLGLGAWGLLASDRLDEAEIWVRDCLRLVEEEKWVAFRPWPVAVLGELQLRRPGGVSAISPLLEESFALSCQLADPCWEAATARAIALVHAAANDLPRALGWLAEARRRCTRDTDRYEALHVTILATQAELLRRQGNAAEAGAAAREWVSRAARAHMDAHVARAASFITKDRQEDAAAETHGLRTRQ